MLLLISKLYFAHGGQPEVPCFSELGVEIAMQKLRRVIEAFLTWLDGEEHVMELGNDFPPSHDHLESPTCK